MTTAQKKTLYGVLCVAALLVSLSGSLIMNVRPYILHHDGWMATVQVGLALGAALIPLAMESDLHLLWKIAGIGLLFILFTVCLGNGIESSTLTRADVSFAREDKIATTGDWRTQIEQWSQEKTALQGTYAPTTDEDLRVAQERRDTACKIPTSNDCRTAQSDLKKASHDLGLTRRVDKIEEDIRSARGELRKLGTPPPDHLKQATADADALPFNPLKNRPAWMAFGCEGLAAIGMKFFMALINSLFVKGFGQKWWEEQESPTRDYAPQSKIHPVEFKHELPLPPPPKGPMFSEKRQRYIPGIEEWLKLVRPAPGVQCARYTPGQVYPYYIEFCQQEGFTSSHLTVFGSLLRNEGGLKPVSKRGGQNFYLLNPTTRGGTRLALVKTGG